jgi:spoIIIJ-associated protein
VEWVEVAGKTVDEATEHALDKLGVAAADAEVVVLNEPKVGLFGRLKEEARVQARVRPVGARPKRERSRDRRGRSGQGGERSSRGSRASSGGRGSQTQTRVEETGAESTNGDAAAAGAAASARASRSARSSGSSASEATSARTSGSAAPGSGRSRSARRRRSRSRASSMAAQNGSSREDGERTAALGAGPASAGSGEVGDGSGERSTVPTGPTGPKETTEMAEGMTLEEQGEVGRQFLSGLLSEYGIEASLETRVIDDETIEIAASGEDLGVLVGPRGSTLAALQDLTRAVVQRQCPSRTDRILVDVAGYREKRSAALKRFSAQIAEEVLDSGQERALEPMSPADRKAVHDAVNEIDGVVTRSEGEDPHRHIVIAPQG